MLNITQILAFVTLKNVFRKKCCCTKSLSFPTPFSSAVSMWVHYRSRTGPSHCLGNYVHPNNQRICVETTFVSTNSSLAKYYVNLSCMPFVIFILFNIDVQMWNKAFFVPLLCPIWSTKAWLTRKPWVLPRGWGGVLGIAMRIREYSDYAVELESRIFESLFQRRMLKAP